MLITSERFITSAFAKTVDLDPQSGASSGLDLGDRGFGSRVLGLASDTIVQSIQRSCCLSRFGTVYSCTPVAENITVIPRQLPEQP
jgi:hypothetical protein